jgi:uncharacterized membrane protein YebE (DUF533 family)
MGIGALFVAGGVAASVLSPQFTGGNTMIAFWGAVLVGAAMMIRGLMEWQKARAAAVREAATAAAVASAPEASVSETSIDDRLAIRAMAYVAAVDHVLDEGEVYMIQTVSQRLLGDFVSTGKIHEVFAAMKTHDFSAELIRSRPALTEPGCDGIVRAAILSALADGDMSATEERAIVEIANLLGVGGDRLQASVNEAHAIFEELLRAQDRAAAA